MILALIITNIILTIAMVIVAVALIVEMTKDSRPIVIKEAKALRGYYDGKLKDLQEKADKAEQKYDEYKGLYENELQKNGDVSSIRGDKIRLEAQVKRLSNELDLCDDRISDMAQENAGLKKKIEELKKATSNKPTKKGKK